jgi:hypothetical protein
MFNGVRGEGIKKFFNGRRGRNLSFASNEPVKIQAGADIVEIAQGAVDKNTDNLIIASLKATIEDLKIQLAVKQDATLQAKLDWATEYLSKFEKEVEKIRKKQPTPKPQPKPQPNKKDHELKTILSNIKMQSERVLKTLKSLPFLLVKDDFDAAKAEIEKINEQVVLYEQSVQAYKAKGGTEEYPKIEFSRLKVVYKLIAKKIAEFKDELKENSEEKYEVKQNIILLEKFADDLVKFAPSPEAYVAIRTEVDKELAESAKKNNEPEPIVTPPAPAKPSYQDAVEAYEKAIDELNSVVAEMNASIAKIEELNNNSELTVEQVAEYIQLEESIKQCTAKIEHFKVTMAAMRKDGKDQHKIDIAKLTCIQNKKVEKIQYKMNFEAYVESLDRKAILVIKKIKELELSKTNASKEDIEKINQEIVILYKFLLAINSLIDKRIVQYSKVNHKNITELYKNRLAKRKAMVSELEIGMTEHTIQPVEGKTEIEIFQERIVALSEKWLKAIRTAPIDRKGNLLIDEKVYAEEMSILIANSHDEAKLKTVITASEEFNRARGQLIKDKRAALNKFREKVTTRITLIFQSGTIEETVKPGIDYNEWLKEIEYAELIHLANEPEYKGLIPNTEDLIKEYIADQEKKYRGIKKRQQSDVIENLSNDFAELIATVEKVEVDENFEQNVTAIFEAMKEKYKVLKDFTYKVDFEHNIVTINYKSTQYEFSSGAYNIVPQEFEHVIMSQNKYKQYRASKNIEPEEPEVAPVVEPNKTDETPEAEIKFGSPEPSNAKVTNRTLQLATNRRQVIDRAKNLIIKNADSLTVSLIKQGLRIRYNENLRDQLKALNAKLSLVNKNNYRSRKDIKFKGEETEQDLAFKGPKENFNIEDYKLEVRLVDDDKKRSDLLYSFDLENISDELHGRTK